MKKLKTIFSPKKLILWLFILILIIGVPEFSRPSMSETEALVNMLCVEKKDEKYEVASLVLTPGQERKINTQVYTGNGSTLGEAVNNVAISIGKQMGFAQCEIIAFGENVCEESIVPVIDYMTRTKKVGRSSVLVSFSGDINDFANACSNLSQEKALRLDRIINYDKRYIMAKDSNIDSFYKGYYSEISLGVMPHLYIASEQTSGAIEVAMQQQNQPSKGEASADSSGEKKYLTNDGTTSVFVKGVKLLELMPEQVVDLNLLQNNEQEGVIKVENVTDELYENATIIFALKHKEIKVATNFEGETPVYTLNLELRVLVDEVTEERPGKEFMRRNKEFLTATAIKKLEETLKSNMFETIEFCKTNQIDLLNAFKNFYSRNHKQFMDYYSKNKSNFLEGIDFRINIEINSAY